MVRRVRALGVHDERGSDELGQLPLHGPDRAADRPRREPLLAERHALLAHDGDRSGHLRCVPAYDVQKLKRYEPPPGSDAEVAEKAAIVGALALYLDFVN